MDTKRNSGRRSAGVLRESWREMVASAILGLFPRGCWSRIRQRVLDSDAEPGAANSLSAPVACREGNYRRNPIESWFSSRQPQPPIFRSRRGEEADLAAFPSMNSESRIPPPYLGGYSKGSAPESLLTKSPMRIVSLNRPCSSRPHPTATIEPGKKTPEVGDKSAPEVRCSF